MNKNSESFGAKFTRFLIMIVMLFVIVVGVMIGDKLRALNKDALSLAMGLGMGCLVGLVPVAVILAGIYIAVRWWDARELRRATRYPQQMQPPVIIVPTGGYLPQQQPWSEMPVLTNAQGSRQFNVIGDEE